jgi:hypothetical protein
MTGGLRTAWRRHATFALLLAVLPSTVAAVRPARVEEPRSRVSTWMLDLIAGGCRHDDPGKDISNVERT